MTQAPVTCHLSPPTGKPDNLTGGALAEPPPPACHAGLSGSQPANTLRHSRFRARPVSLSGCVAESLTGGSHAGDAHLGPAHPTYREVLGTDAYSAVRQVAKWFGHVAQVGALRSAPTSAEASEGAAMIINAISSATDAAVTFAQSQFVKMPGDR